MTDRDSIENPYLPLPDGDIIYPDPRRVSLQIESDAKETNLARLTIHQLKNRDRLFSGKRQLIYLFMQLIAVLTLTYMYVGPAKKYTEGKSGFEEIAYIMGTVASSLVLTYVVSDMFFDEKEKEATQDNLRDILDASPRNNSCITTGSCLVSVPYALVGIQYPIIKSLAFLIFYVSLLQAGNTVLHFFPVLLALTHKAYGAPCRIVRKIWNWLKQMCMTDEQLLALYLQKQEAIDCRALTEPLVQKLEYIATDLNPQMITRNGCQFNLNFPASLDFKHASGIEILQALIESVPNSIAPRSSNHPAFIYLQRFVHVLTAAWIDLTFIGYFAGPITTIFNLTTELPAYQRNLLLAAIAVPQDYFLFILMSYIGGGAGERIFNYIVNCVKSKQLILPPEVKLHFPAFLMSILPATFLTWYSPGAAPQVIKDNLASFPARYLNFLSENSKWGIRFLAAITFLDFFLLVANKWMVYKSKKFQKENDKEFMRYQQCLANLPKMIKSMHPAALKADLSLDDAKSSTPKLSSNDLQTFFGVHSTEELKQKLNHKANLEKRLVHEVNHAWMPSLYAKKQRMLQILQEDVTYLPTSSSFSLLV